MNRRLTEVLRVWRWADTQVSRGRAGKTEIFTPWGQIPLWPFFYLEPVCPGSTWLLGNSTPRTKLLSQPGSAPLTPSFLASSTAMARARRRWGVCMQSKGDSAWSPSRLSPGEKQQAWLQEHRFLPLTHLYNLAAAPHQLPLQSPAIPLNLPIWPFTCQSLPWIL